jgi:hypothetical protein
MEVNLDGANFRAELSRASLAGHSHEPTLSLGVRVGRVDGLVEEGQVDPVRRVFESSCIEEKHLVHLLIEATNRRKVTVPSLPQCLAAQVDDGVQTLPSRGGQHCRPEKLLITASHIGSACVVMKSLSRVVTAFFALADVLVVAMLQQVLVQVLKCPVGPESHCV